MVSIELDVDALVAALQQAGENLSGNLSMALELGADLVAAHAKTSHGYTDRTGLLTNSIDKGDLEGSFKSQDLTITVSAGAPYAVFVEEGTRPHKIRPRFRKSLRWPVEGGFAFAKEVDHPGTRAVHFLRGAMEAKLPDVEQLLKDATALSFSQAGFETAA
jgi:hypothetical protein